MFPRASLLPLLFLIASSSVPAAVIYVDDSAPGPLHDGKSWETACLDVTAGYAKGVAGDEVWVAAGVYVNRITLRRGVDLYGGFAGNETERSQRNWRKNATILDGSAGGAVVTTVRGSDKAILDGFTIRNGFGPTQSDSYPSGGGVLCLGGAPNIRNNLFIRNYALKGGAIFCNGGSPLIENNRFIANHADTGSAIQTEASGAATIRNNVIQGNSGFRAVYLMGPSGTFTGNTLVQNAGTSLTVAAKPFVIQNNIIGWNGRGVSIDTAATQVVFRRNLIYGNYAYPFHGPFGFPWTDENLDVDPRLASTALGDVHLLPGSPCIDYGDTAGIEAGGQDMDGEGRIGGGAVDIGADEFSPSVTHRLPVVVRVSPTGDDANDGRDWDHAKRTLQAAMDEVTLNGGEVWVAAGTYVGNPVVGPYTALLGGFNGVETEREQRDPSVSRAILDGNMTGSALRIYSGYAPLRVDGLTFRNGNGTTWYGGSQRNGGGIFSRYTSAVISNNTVEDNTATVYGGGIFHDGDRAVIEGNVVRRNRSITPSADSVGGGGIHVAGNDVLVRNNLITENMAGNGGGILVYQGTVKVTGNTISNNQATVASQGGGGMVVFSYNDAIEGNVITGNKSFGLGGGVRLYYISRLRNNLIRGNTAVNGGGVAGPPDYAPSLVNNTIVENTASQQGGGIYVTDASLINNIVAFNSSGVYASSASNIIQNSAVFGNTAYDVTGTPFQHGAFGNVLVDPKFVDRPAGDFRLQAFSPLLDAGSDSVFTPGDTDMAGSLRRLGLHVDIGAYEWVPDGVVTLADAATALRIAAGLTAASPEEATRLDMVEGGGVDIADAVRLARKANGRDRNP